MPVGADLHLRGRLERGPYGLVLRIGGGGAWEIEARCRSRRLVGREVEVVGRRAGFNRVSCDQIWLAGQPRPRQPKVNVEYLLTAGLVGYGFIAFLGGLIGYFR